MKDLMKSNIYDCSDKIIIVGSCLKAMQPKAFEELETMNLPIFELCLEQTHINMAITKLLGMIRARKISKVDEIILIINALSIIIALFITNNLDFFRVFKILDTFF